MVTKGTFEQLAEALARKMVRASLSEASDVREKAGQRYYEIL